MKDLLPLDKTLRIKTEKGYENFEFEEPTLYTILMFHRLIQKAKYIEAVRSIVNIPDRFLLKAPQGIIKAILQLLYDDEKTKGEGFFPATIDFFCKRYGISPMEFMKTTTISQLETLSKGVEYNTNIEIGKSEKNFMIVNEGKTMSKEEQETNERLKNVEDIFLRKLNGTK